MGRPVKRSLLLKTARLLAGYGLGTLCWVLGFHCLEPVEGGGLRLDGRRWLRHGLKLGAWVTALGLLGRAWPAYGNWIMNVPILTVTLAFLVKGLIFLYVRVFWPSKLVELVPGVRHFLCPQCLRRETFRFTPVSFRFGFFVTYLCRYCFCLVDGWGRQIFFPAPFSPAAVRPFWARLVPVSAAVALAGW
ncbi:MAG TPA: hypothetical protein VFR02_03895, partial [bacterium]|nr:hypothetical protein [bacterium]